MDKSVSVSQEQNCAECPGRANYEKSSCPPTLPHFHTSTLPHSHTSTLPHSQTSNPNPNPNPPTLQEIAQNLTLKYKNPGSALRINVGKMLQGFRSTSRRSIHKLTILCLSYTAWSSLGWVAEDWSFFHFHLFTCLPFPLSSSWSSWYLQCKRSTGVHWARQVQVLWIKYHPTNPTLVQLFSSSSLPLSSPLPSSS